MPNLRGVRTDTGYDRLSSHIARHLHPLVFGATAAVLLIAAERAAAEEQFSDWWQQTRNEFSTEQPLSEEDLDWRLSPSDSTPNWNAPQNRPPLTPLPPSARNGVEEFMRAYLLPENPAAPSVPPAPEHVAFGRTLEFREVNVAIKVPGWPWKNESTSFDPNIRVAMSRIDPGLGLVLVAERVGVETNCDPRMALTIMKRQTRAKSPSVTFTTETEETVNGIPGFRYDAFIPGRYQLHYARWIGAKNGFVYQLMVFGNVNDSERIRAELKNHLAGLRQIQPQEVAHADGARPVTQFASPSFGYEVELKDEGWVQAKFVDAKLAGAEFSATNGLSTIRVFVLPLPDHCPNLEALNKTLLVQLGLDFPTDCTDRTPLQLGPLSGEKFCATRFVDGDRVTYHIRIAADEKSALLVMGMAEDSSAEELAKIDRALDGVRIVSRDLERDPPAPDRHRRFWAVTLNDLGVDAYQHGDHAVAKSYFAKAIACNPNNQVAIENYIDMLESLKQYGEALEIVESQADRHPENLKLRALRAKLIVLQGRVEEGCTAYKELFARGFTDERALKEYIDLAAVTEDYGSAIEATAAVARHNPSANVRRWLASLQSLNDEHDVAIASLQKLRQEYPDDTAVLVDLANAHVEAKQFEQALALTQPLVDEGNNDLDLLLVHGRIQMHMNRFADAKQTFERVAEIYPHHELARQLIVVASNQLGEGENSLFKTPLEPVPMHPEVADAIASAATQPNEVCALYGAEELAHVTTVEFIRNRPLRTTTLQRVKVHTPGGVSRYSTFSFPLDPTTERFFVNKLTVRDAAGQVVAEGNVQNYFLADDDDAEVKSNRKSVQIPVPGLKPGYTIDCQVTYEDKFSSERFRLQKADLSSAVPIDVSAFCVRGDVAGLQFKTSTPMRTAQTADAIYCIQANAPPLQDEYKQPPLEKFMPIVWVGTADARWDALANEYLQKISDRLVIDEETSKLARELTKDCHTDRERLATLSAWVQANITYQAIEFGCRGRVPNTAAQTVALKYGDCKDHAVILQQLLRGVDIPAYLAVVNSSGPVIQELPSLEQFNHMVLFVPGDRVGAEKNAVGGLVVDVSTKETNPLAFPPYRMANMSVLVLDPAQPRFVQLPGYELDAGQLFCQRRVTISELPNSSVVEARVNERVTLNDYLAPAMRGYLRMSEPGARREAIQDVLEHYARVRVQKLEVENLDDTTKPLVMYMEYVAPDALHRLSAPGGEKTLIGQLPCIWETHYLEAEYDEQRMTPFEFNTPRWVQTSLEIVLPPGYRLAESARWTNAGQSEFAAWSAQTRENGSTILLDHRVRVPAGRHQPAKYQPYYAAMKETLSLLQTPVTLSGPALSTAGRVDVLRR